MGIHVNHEITFLFINICCDFPEIATSLQFKKVFAHKRFHSEFLLQPLQFSKQGKSYLSARFKMPSSIYFSKMRLTSVNKNPQKLPPPLTDCIVLYYCIPFYFVCVAWVSAWSTQLIS